MRDEHGKTWSARIARIFCHPVKGLSPMALDSARLTVGHGIIGDRAFGLLFTDVADLPPGRRLPGFSKFQFAMQNDWPSLAALACRYDPGAGLVTVAKDGHELIRFSVHEEQELLAADRFFTEYIATSTPARAAKHSSPAPIRWIGDSNGATRYPDRSKYHVSILNEASLVALGESVGTSLDVRRFRGNLIVTGAPPWAELGWEGTTVDCGGARLTIQAKIGRCNNINVDPDKGSEGPAVLMALAKSPGRGSFGVLATVERTGDVAVGDDFRWAEG